MRVTGIEEVKERKARVLGASSLWTLKSLQTGKAERQSQSKSLKDKEIEVRTAAEVMG